MGETGKITVLITDDHVVFRQGLTKLINSEEDIEIVGQAGSGIEAENLVKELRPKVVLMDIDMPEQDGIETTIRLKDSCPEIEIIILSAFEDDQHLFKAIKAGASGYISKHSKVEEITTAIRAASQGESSLTPALSRKVLDKLMSSEKNGSDLQEQYKLTIRETEILQLICQAKTNSQIAYELYISKRTVRNHIYSIFQKLHVHARTEAMLKAQKFGLIDKDF